MLRLLFGATFTSAVNELIACIGQECGRFDPHQVDLPRLHGELTDSLAEEARALLKWLVDTHERLPRSTQATVENNIRTEYRRLKHGTK